LLRHLADGSDNDNVSVNTVALLAEVGELRRRLAALEERLPGDPPEQRPGRQGKWRTSTKTVLCLAMSAMLAMLAGASLVYGQGGVQAAADALFIKEGRVGIGTGTAIPAATLDVRGGLLHVAGTTTPTVTSQGAYLGWNALTGNTGETDFINNQGLGSGGFAFMNAPPSGEPRTTLMVISGGGNVGIGKLSPNDRLNVDGSARMAGLNVDGTATMTGLEVTGSSNSIPGLKVPGTNTLEFGADVSGKQVDAGKIAYQRFSGDALDIVGAGTDGTNRKIKFWAEGGATLAGGLTVSGNVKIGAQGVSAAGGAESLRIIRGTINPDGSKVQGEGFTIKKVDQGLYEIVFTPAFPFVPAASATQIFPNINANPGPTDERGSSSQSDFANIAYLSPDRMRIKTAIPGGFSDRAFSFIVIGPQ
jgi:hypothetical protein